jgi:hypothetical protein
MVFMPAGECAGHLTCLNGKQSFNIGHFGYFNNVLVLLCSMMGGSFSVALFGAGANVQKLTVTVSKSYSEL